MLPRHTILVPGPARVISAFICLGVRFCASSRMMYRLRNVRPRMKFSERILMRLRSRSLVAARPQLPPSWLCVSTSRLSISAPIHGPILLSLGAGQEADVLAERDRHARHDDLAVAVALQRLREARGQRQQRLAG